MIKRVRNSPFFVENVKWELKKKSYILKIVNILTGRKREELSMSRVKKAKDFLGKTFDQTASPRVKKAAKGLRMRESQVRQNIKRRSARGKEDLKRLIGGATRSVTSGGKKEKRGRRR